MFGTGPAGVGERGGQGRVGEPDVALACPARGPLVRVEHGGSGPFGERLRSRGHREGGECAGVAQPGRARVGDYLVERQPLEPSADAGISRAGRPSRQPYLEHRPSAGRRCRAEEPDLPVRAAEVHAQDLAARFLTGPAPHRHRQRRRLREKGDGALVEGDDPHLAAAARALRQPLALEIAQQRGCAVHFVHEQGTQAVPCLQHPSHRVDTGSPGGEQAEFDLQKGLRPLVAAHRDYVVDQLVACPGEPARTGAPYPPLRLELDTGDELARLDEGAQAARWVRRAGERLFPLQLGHLGLEPLRPDERDAAVRMAGGAHGE